MESEYQCDLCNKQFASKYTLKNHQRIHQDRKRSFVCSDCGKK